MPWPSICFLQETCLEKRPEFRPTSILTTLQLEYGNFHCLLSALRKYSVTFPWWWRLPLSPKRRKTIPVEQSVIDQKCRKNSCKLSWNCGDSCNLYAYSGSGTHFTHPYPLRPVFAEVTWRWNIELSPPNLSKSRKYVLQWSVQVFETRSFLFGTIDWPLCSCTAVADLSLQSWTHYRYPTAHGHKIYSLPFR